MNCGKCGEKITSTSGICSECSNEFLNYTNSSTQKINKVSQLEYEIENLRERIKIIEELLAL